MTHNFLLKNIFYNYIKQISQEYNKKNIIFFNKIDSTNNYAKKTLSNLLINNNELPTKINKSIIIAKKQTNGRGRLGRTFISNKKGIYFSLIFLSQKYNLLPEDYTIYSAVAICRVLNLIYNINVNIKWINDIFIKNKKLAGILTEAFFNYKTKEIQAIIVGIGINLKKNNKIPNELKNIITSLAQVCNKKINYIKLLSELCMQLFTILNEPKEKIILEYKKLSCLLNKDVNIHYLSENDNSKDFIATVIDINQNGNLIVKTKDSNILTLSSCDVTLHNKKFTYGVIGEKLSHSFSKEIHQQLGINDYKILELSKDNLKPFLQNKEFNAINVTIPYKQEVLPYLDFIDDKAKQIGCVNTIINQNGKLFGYNTDYYGLYKLINFYKIKIHNKKVLILGTGGTSKTAFCVCKDLGAKEIIFVSRTKNENSITYEQAMCTHKDTQIIINTTPVGMHPNNDECPINVTLFKKLDSVIDVIYNPIKSKLIRDAKQNNIKVASGLLMLVFQAIKANELFFSKKISIKKGIKIYKNILYSKQNIVLIGMPTSGKTTIANELSKILNKPFIDTDELIQNQENKFVRDIILENGIEYFRKKEQEIINQIYKKQNCIISCGGGIILNKQNIELLGQNGIIYFIDRKLKLLKPSKSRPLSQDFFELKKLYNQRYTLYKQYCDYQVRNNTKIESTIKKIIKLLNKGDIF